MASAGNANSVWQSDTSELGPIVAKPIEIPLAFSRIECRCKSARIVGETCPICGAKPAATEVDPKRQRRQGIARSVRAMDCSELESDSSSIEEISAKLKGLLDDFLYAARRVAMATDDNDGLILAAKAIRRVRLGLESRNLRPLLGVAHRLLISVDEIESAVESTLLALSADTPLAAQQLSEKMQASINLAAKSNSEAQELVRIWRTLSNSDTPLIAWVTEAFGVFVPEGVLINGYLDFDEIGSKLLRSRIDERCPRGFGITVALIDFISRLSFSESRFWSIVEEQRDFLLSNRTVLISLTEDSTWQGDWDRHSLSLWETGERARALYGIAKSDDNFVWTSLTVAHDLEEGPVKQLLATLQCIAGVPDGYQSIQAKGVANLAEWAKSRRLQASESFGPAIRNAHAHHDYAINGNSITLCPLRPPAGGSLTLSADEFADSVIAVVEAAMAMWMGTVFALSKIGLPFDGSLIAERFQIELGATALMGLGGWRDIRAEIVNATLVLEGVADRDPLIIEFLTLVPFVPDDLKFLHARLESPSGFIEIEVPLNRLKGVNEASDSQRMIAFLVLCSEILVNGEALTSREQVRKVIAVEAMRFGANPDINVSRKGLRELRAACRTINDPDLEAGVARIQTIRLLGNSGLPIREMEFESIQNWAAAQLKPGRWASLLSRAGI